ncbi:MAG: Wzz/FepE/Etk N-terminal domain-containing protein [candidate division WOR-3 bacterium]|nr:Wzz/FepE/Etk N-terminal domain-containing protein [candidate division WOR-3 bacterium]
MGYKRITLSELIQYFTNWRTFIIRNVILVTILAVIISLLIPNKYTATASILPPNPSQDIMFGLMPSLAYQTGTASLSRLGILAGGATQSDIFVAIMKSSTVRGRIIERFNLKKEFKAKTMHDTFKALDRITSIKVSTEGIISVSVTYKNKFLAADIANAFIEELDRFNKENTMTTGKKYRVFIEQRLKGVEDTLAQAEEALRNFQKTHRTVNLNTEIENVIETIAKLKSEIILREVQKGAVIYASGVNNPYLANIEQELRELKRQLSKIEFGDKEGAKDGFGAGFSVPLVNLPEVTLEYARLLRNLKVQEAIYELLMQQYEQAKMMEAKDTPTVQILDRASPPEKKSFPRRTYIVVFAFLLSFFFSFPLIFFLEYLNEVKTQPEKHTVFINLTRAVKEDILKIKNRLRKGKN